MEADAPFHAHLASGPEGGGARWLRAADGVRLRVAHWPGGTRGTILIFPGRTEMAEKYGMTAVAVVEAGFTCLAIDWRGQGLSDRSARDPMVGHVGSFAEYQLDVDAVLGMVRAAGLPEPLYVLSHSMGGAIALRTLIRLPGTIRAAVFSAPMWGIRLSPAMRSAAVVMASLARLLGQGRLYAPTTNGTSTIAAMPFKGNLLTTDPDMYAWMKRQVTDAPELQLGGPSIGWLGAALAECQALSTQSSPKLPVICGLGTAEAVVDPVPVHERMAKWGSGQLDLYPGAMHELPMELPAIRRRFHQRATTLFQSTR
jgi:lysophospholipase